MTRKLCTWTVLAIVAGGLLAGCGSSSSTTSSSQSTSTPAAASSTPVSTPATTPTTSTAPSTAPSVPPADLQAAVTACKQTIQAQKTLSAGAKSKLEAVCGKAAKGDTAAVKQAAREVCEEVIKTSPVPPGPARERALASCKGK
jgi:acyl-CoA synthetase (NDP forming)